MRTKLEPLLCELHAHTTWSDGLLSPRELCDLYGRAGFDVLAVTDHTVRGGGNVDAEASTRTSTRYRPRRSAPGPCTTCS
jgi:predicted metal-dependent phosphoesterase TrpH